MANNKLTERWRFCYTQSTEDGNTMIDVDINFENVDDNVLAQRIATFLVAAGRVNMAKIEDKNE